MTTPTQPKHPVREGLVDAGIRLLADQGASALVMRRVAAAAGVSTMCAYSRFGDKAGLLDAILIAGSERFDSEMASANEGSDPLGQIMSLALAYRRFAMANPALYMLLFERTVEVGPPATTG